MPELEPNAILEFCNKAIEDGASYDEVISQLDMTKDIFAEADETDDEDEDEESDEEDAEDEG